MPPDRRWAVRLRFACGGLAYLLVIGGAFLSAPAALGFSGLVGVYYIFERTPDLARQHDSRQGGLPTVPAALPLARAWSAAAARLWWFACC